MTILRAKPTILSHKKQAAFRGGHSLSKKSSVCWAFCFRCGIIDLVIEMLEKNVQNRNQVEIICIEDLVPQDHLLRKIVTAQHSPLYQN